MKIRTIVNILFIIVAIAICVSAMYYIIFNMENENYIAACGVILLFTSAIIIVKLSYRYYLFGHLYFEKVDVGLCLVTGILLIMLSAIIVLDQSCNNDGLMYVGPSSIFMMMLSGMMYYTIDNNVI